MDLEHRLISKIIETRDLLTVLEAGITRDFFTFASHKSVFAWIVGFYQRESQVPSVDALEREYPTYKLDHGTDSLSYLIGELRQGHKSILVEDGLVIAAKAWEAGDVDGALGVLDATRRRVDATIPTSTDVTLNASARAGWPFVFEPREPGIPFGLRMIDEHFGGLRAGQLLTLIGRQKSGKTWHLVKGAHAALRQGYTGAFVSFELSQEQIMMRLIASIARVSYERMYKQLLTESERVKVLQAMKYIQDWPAQLHILHCTDSMTIPALDAKIEKYEPHVLYIDGFYFLEDVTPSVGGKSGWEINENIARDLKKLAAKWEIPIVVTTQAQEKQIRGDKVTIDTIQGGTGPLKASDGVLTINQADRETGIQEVEMPLNREGAPTGTKLTWNHQDSTFKELGGQAAFTDQEKAW